MAQVAALPIISAQSSLARYFAQIRRFLLLESQEEFMLAKRWLERGDRDAEHRLVTSHLRLVAKIGASIQEYLLRSWSLVKLGTTANQRKLFFNLRRAKSEISALEDGDLRLEQVMVIARRLRVSEDDVIQMNRRLGGDASLNAPIGDHGDSGDWQDWLVDDAPSQERVLIETEELDNRRGALLISP
jgi:RNA polymerase sigma-32 factor